MGEAAQNQQLMRYFIIDPYRSFPAVGVAPVEWQPLSLSAKT